MNVIVRQSLLIYLMILVGVSEEKVNVFSVVILF